MRWRRSSLLWISCVLWCRGKQGAEQSSWLYKLKQKALDGTDESSLCMKGGCRAKEGKPQGVVFHISLQEDYGVE